MIRYPKLRPETKVLYDYLKLRYFNTVIAIETYEEADKERNLCDILGIEAYQKNLDKGKGGGFWAKDKMSNVYYRIQRKKIYNQFTFVLIENPDGQANCVTVIGDKEIMDALDDLKERILIKAN